MSRGVPSTRGRRPLGARRRAPAAQEPPVAPGVPEPPAFQIPPGAKVRLASTALPGGFVVGRVTSSTEDVLGLTLAGDDAPFTGTPIADSPRIGDERAGVAGPPQLLEDGRALRRDRRGRGGRRSPDRPRHVRQLLLGHVLLARGGDRHLGGRRCVPRWARRRRDQDGEVAEGERRGPRAEAERGPRRPAGARRRRRRAGRRSVLRREGVMRPVHGSRPSFAAAALAAGLHGRPRAARPESRRMTPVSARRRAVPTSPIRLSLDERSARGSCARLGAAIAGEAAPALALALAFEPRVLGYSFDPGQLVLRDGKGRRVAADSAPRGPRCSHGACEALWNAGDAARRLRSGRRATRACACLRPRRSLPASASSSSSPAPPSASAGSSRSRSGRVGSSSTSAASQARPRPVLRKSSVPVVDDGGRRPRWPRIGRSPRGRL